MSGTITYEVELRLGQSFHLRNCQIKFISARSDRVRLGVDAPRSVLVERAELRDGVHWKREETHEIGGEG